MEIHIGKMIGNERRTEGSIYYIKFAYNSKLIYDINVAYERVIRHHILQIVLLGDKK